MQNIGLFCRALLQKRPRRVSQALRRGAQALPIRSEQKSVYGVETPLPSPAPKGAGLRHFPFAPNKRVYTGSKPRSQAPLPRERGFLGGLASQERIPTAHFICAVPCPMRWLRFVGSLKTYVSFIGLFCKRDL